VSAPATRGFYKLCLSTLVAVYFLILVGGIVRTTGSGMGCPDWPKCFGEWIPPTAVSQLPENYKEEYSQLRERKNKKFAEILSAIGMKESAFQILNDKSILEEADFNPLKTYIEYINRLIGVVIGLLIAALFFRSLSFRTSNPRFVMISFATLIGVILQGWFGSIVVSTNLTSWTITIHMFLALVIVALLVYLLHIVSNPVKIVVKPYIRILTLAGIVLLAIQVFLGTEVRTAIDRIAATMQPRASWIGLAGADFIIHRSFSWLVLLVNLGVLLAIRKTTSINPLTITLTLLILLSVLTGAGMAYFSMPAFLQPLHLLIVTMTCGTQFLLLFRLETIRATA
jgi:heme a synthase